MLHREVNVLIETFLWDSVQATTICFPLHAYEYQHVGGRGYHIIYYQIPGNQKEVSKETTLFTSVRTTCIYTTTPKKDFKIFSFQWSAFQSQITVITTSGKNQQTTHCYWTQAYSTLTTALKEVARRRQNNKFAHHVNTNNKLSHVGQYFRAGRKWETNNQIVVALPLHEQRVCWSVLHEKWKVLSAVSVVLQ